MRSRSLDEEDLPNAIRSPTMIASYRKGIYWIVERRRRLPTCKSGVIMRRKKQV